MTIVGTFHITDSFTLTGRGLVACGDLTGGRVKVGDYVTFTTDEERVTMRIRGVETGRWTSRETDLVGLTFEYRDDEERMRFEGIQLKEQDVDIVDNVDETG
jgi:translation elongation factor EF-Tu-like GTPase